MHAKHHSQWPSAGQTIVLCCWLMLLLLSGCKNDSQGDDSDAVLAEERGANPVLDEHFIPASEQRAGNPELGYEALITQPIVSCGLPIQVFEQVDTAVDTDLLRRSGDAAKLPYSFNLIEDENQVQLAAGNCLSCHAAPLFGNLVIGLGNEFLDFSDDASIQVEQAGALVSGDNAIAAWEKYADRIAAIAPYMRTRSAGVNPANNLTFALMAHRDRNTLAWHEDALLDLPPAYAPPVSVPPWWRMQKKHAMFWMGEGRGDHASMMMAAAILCTDSVDELAQLDAIAPDVRAYIASLEPPKYPFAIDQQLAQQGRAVFESTCSQCHGRYGDDAVYPNRIVDIAAVGTDAALIDFAFGAGQTYVDWFNQSPFGELARAQPSRGYVAPPLDGIWATAPFLHNGSVPSIRLLLNSALRPTLWHHRVIKNPGKEDYDTKNLGWAFATVDEADDTSAIAIGEQWVYDTRRVGYGNAGHQFGDGLTPAQRDAVIEYLKTL